MALFNWFGEQEHRVFDYKPQYYDKDKKLKENYTPGSYIKGTFKEGRYSRYKTHSSKAQTIIGLVGLLLVFAVLYFIAKFYSLL